MGWEVFDVTVHSARRIFSGIFGYLLFILLGMLVCAQDSRAQETTSIFVFDVEESTSFRVLRNDAHLTTATSTSEGVVRCFTPTTAGDRFEIFEDTTSTTQPPLPPIAVSASASTQWCASVSWLPSSNPEVVGYVVSWGRSSVAAGAPAYSASHTVWNGASHDICGLPTCTWYFTVKSLNFLDMTSAYSPEDTVVIDPHPTGVRNGKSRFILDQNSPNPFNPTTAISFEIPTSAKVRLEVFDVRGALVATLVNDDMPPGRQSVVWDGSNSRGHPVASGHYFYRLTAGKEVITKKMILLK
jgi:hypothetical protein